MEILLVESRKISEQMGKLLVLPESMKRLETAFGVHIEHCREDMCKVYEDVKELKEAKAKKQGACEATKMAWYRNPHWWHTAFVTVGVLASLYYSTKGVIH
jgi:hypothetical protein